MRAQHAPGVLDEAAFEGDRRGEEQGVQGRAVEALADVGAGGDGEKRWPVGSGLEPGECGGAGLGSHAAAQDDRGVPASPPRGGGGGGGGGGWAVLWGRTRRCRRWVGPAPGGVTPCGVGVSSARRS